MTAKKIFLSAWVVALVLGVCLVYLSNYQILKRARGLTFKNVGEVPSQYVAIILGAKVWGNEPSSVLEDRLIAAKALLDAGKVKKLLVSGDHGGENYDEVNVMQQWLLSHGVTADKIFLDHAGFRTNDTMQRAARVFEVKRAVIVTQAFHLPRSLYLARNAGIEAVGFVADRRRYVGERYNRVREALARVSAFLEVNFLGTEPKFLGETHPIEGHPASTWDANTHRDN